jgi:type IV pilus assembly protein PilA
MNTLSARIRNARTGFTLIELLVVVLILAILMSVAIPLYLSAVSDSQKKTCRANMQTIANAVQANKVKAQAADYSTYMGSITTGTTGNEPDLNSIPNCPNNGTYTIVQGSSGDNTTFAVSCSATNHGTFQPGVDHN